MTPFFLNWKPDVHFLIGYWDIHVEFNKVRRKKERKTKEKKGIRK